MGHDDLDLAARRVRERLAEYSVPEHLRPGLEAYLVRRVAPGGFLRAALEDQLRVAVLYASDETLGGLRSIVAFLHNAAPAQAHGSPAKVAAWLCHSGFEAAHAG